MYLVTLLPPTFDLEPLETSKCSDICHQLQLWDVTALLLLVHLLKMCFWNSFMVFIVLMTLIVKLHNNKMETMLSRKVDKSKK